MMLLPDRLIINGVEYVRSDTVKPFAVGDRVIYHYSEGCKSRELAGQLGTVVDASEPGAYPVCVHFDSGAVASFTQEGWWHVNDVGRTLFHL